MIRFFEIHTKGYFDLYFFGMFKFKKIDHFSSMILAIFHNDKLLNQYGVFLLFTNDSKYSDVIKWYNDGFWKAAFITYFYREVIYLCVPPVYKKAAQISWKNFFHRKNKNRCKQPFKNLHYNWWHHAYTWDRP